MGLLEQKYAKALVDAGKDNNILPQLWKDFKYFLDFLKRDKDFQFIFLSPVFPDEAQRKAIHHIFENKVSPVFMNFLDVLVERGRECYIKNIYNEFVCFADKAENKIRVLLTTAFPFDSRQEEALNKKLSSKLGRVVIIDKQTDTSIIGGGIIKIGDRVVDGSLVAQLNSLQKELSEC
jgi:F-type H+-transporting ATPase subunit delta